MEGVGMEGTKVSIMGIQGKNQGTNICGYFLYNSHLS